MPTLKRGLTLLVTVAATLLGLLLVTFLFGRVVPIDPVLSALGDRAKLFAIPEGEVWSLMVGNNPAFVELYGAEAAKGVVQVMTRTGSAQQYSRFAAPKP